MNHSLTGADQWRSTLRAGTQHPWAGIPGRAIPHTKRGEQTKGSFLFRVSFLSTPVFAHDKELHRVRTKHKFQLPSSSVHTEFETILATPSYYSRSFLTLFWCHHSFSFYLSPQLLATLTNNQSFSFSTRYGRFGIGEGKLT